MTILLETNTPYWNDLYDITRLFYGDASITRENAANMPVDLLIRHNSGQKGGKAAIFRGDTLLDSETASAIPACADDLERIRLQKRAAKNCLYSLLTRYTGQRQAWGSLTGIRPSRLYAEGLVRAMREGLSLQDAETASMRWLTDTFFVPAEKALRLRDMRREQALVPAPAADECDIYVGIPFCVTRCSYCAFAAVDMRTGGKWVEDYLTALEKEITQSEVIMRGAGYRARAVYVGGGTPTALSAKQLERLLALLNRLFPEAIEWTVEAGRPDTIDSEKLAVMRSLGVGRVSVNPQSMNDDTLRAIGRAHTARNILETYALVREAGFPIVNMDLIAALPGEDVPEITHTTREVLALRPENITLHSLAIKRASQLRIAQGAVPPSPELAARMFEAARIPLEQAGYRTYYLYRQKYMAGNLENIGLSLPGKACLYNIGHMEEIAPILACGAGAITKWLFNAHRRIERAPNIRDVPGYIARIDEMLQRKQKLLERGEWANEEM